MEKNKSVTRDTKMTVDWNWERRGGCRVVVLARFDSVLCLELYAAYYGTSLFPGILQQSKFVLYIGSVSVLYY